MILAGFLRVPAAWLAPLLLLLFVSCGQTDQVARAAEPPEGLIPLSIETATGSHDYLVEVAVTAEDQARGLMFRQKMAPDRGMIFPHDPPRPAAFWMKDTYLPLDMIFITADGHVESVAADTVPLSTQSYRSQGPVAAVLELNAGEAARIGLRPGDRISYALD